MTNYLVVTGGSRGIGEKTIAHFMQQGWNAINISRSACRLAGVKNISVDLSSLDDIDKHANELRGVLKNANHICLVHNAGYYQRDSMNDLSLDNLHRTLTVNVIAAVALNNIVIPLMSAGSSIIYIGSTLSEKAVPNAASYVISKHAVIGLMRTTSQDLMDKSIRSVCICPGFVDTEMVKENFDESLLKQLIENKVMAKRLIEPEEIASVIYFAAISPVLNGAVIHANLGHIAD